MLDAADTHVLTAQTGRRLRGVLSVAARCPAGHPCVVTTYPLRRTAGRLSLFPTLYWLTCPALRAQVSHLERDGVIALLEAELRSDADLRARLAADHDDYVARRWATLSDDDRRLAAEAGLHSAMRERGIGGTSNRAAVKCLHLHLAHHLAGGNAIGRLVVERYGVRPCGA